MSHAALLFLLHLNWSTLDLIFIISKNTSGRRWELNNEKSQTLQTVTKKADLQCSKHLGMKKMVYYLINVSNGVIIVKLKFFYLRTPPHNVN